MVKATTGGSHANGCDPIRRVGSLEGWYAAQGFWRLGVGGRLYGRLLARLLRHGMSLTTAVLHLQAGEWEEAHSIVQDDESSPLSCWAHGIVHLQEGDIENARYWFSRARRPFSKDVAGQVAALAAAVEERPG